MGRDWRRWGECSLGAAVVIYEAVARDTGEILAAFEAVHDQRAAFRLGFECDAERVKREDIALRRAPDPSVYPHITTAVFDWLPKGRVPNG
jgi:hypothetical protein